MKQNKLREELTQTFLDSLKEEKLPWHSLWHSARPCNAVTGKPYRGVNSFWLSMTAMSEGFVDPRWCTFKQAKDKGWKIKKGSESSLVEFWSLYDKKERRTLERNEAARIIKLDPNKEDDIVLMSRIYHVFNAEQIDGIPQLEFTPPLGIEDIREKRDLLLENMGLSFREEGDRAYYQVGVDRVTMPPELFFKSTYGYMSTLLHECGHATGHESRLNRNLSGHFGSPEYAKEELRAEIASAFTAQALNFSDMSDVQNEHMDNHKAYIQSWISVLEDQPNELFASIRDAEKISDYLLEKGEFLQERKAELEKNKTPSLDEKIRDAASRTVLPSPAKEPEKAASF